MKFVVDMNLSPDWVKVLRDAGFEAVHWRDVGPRDAPDSVVLAWAKQHLHVLLTHDLDFGAILAASRAEGPSVLQLRIDDPLPDAHRGGSRNLGSGISGQSAPESGPVARESGARSEQKVPT